MVSDTTEQKPCEVTNIDNPSRVRGIVLGPFHVCRLFFIEVTGQVNYTH